MIERTDHDRDTEIHENRERIETLENTISRMLASPIYGAPGTTEREKALEATIAELRAHVETLQETIQQMMLGPAQVPVQVGGLPHPWDVTIGAPTRCVRGQQAFCGCPSCLSMHPSTIISSAGGGVPVPEPPLVLVFVGEQRPGADQVYRGPAVNIDCAPIMPSGTVLTGVFTTGAKS